MKKILLTAATAVLLMGCLKNNTEDTRTCTYDACAFKAPAAEVEAVKAYLTQNNITAQEHCSGLFYTIDTMGTGPAPTVCSYVSVRYKGMLTNGTVFDKSEVPSQYFPMSNLVAGWKNGLPLIKEGGVMRLYIPPSLGYGSQPQRDQAGNVLIPGNSILVFDVSVVRVN